MLQSSTILLWYYPIPICSYVNQEERAYQLSIWEWRNSHASKQVNMAFLPQADKTTYQNIGTYNTVLFPPQELLGWTLIWKSACSMFICVRVSYSHRRPRALTLIWNSHCYVKRNQEYTFSSEICSRNAVHPWWDN